jgi:hypothetical protein
MKRFAIKSENNTYYCGTDGTVADSAQLVVGRWTTTDKNKILITHSGGTTAEVDVVWRFNDLNQLCVLQGDTEVLRLTGPDIHPKYFLNRNVLQIDPDGDMDFQFPLYALWGLADNGKLKITINNTESLLDGYLEDEKSRFRFWFYDKERPILPSNLIFTGSWKREQEQREKIVLHYILDDPELEDPKAPLILPAEVTVDPKRNHLAFTYQYTGYGTRTLAFHGSLQIKPNWTLLFSVADHLDHGTGVKKSRIEVAATFDWDSFKGGLQLYVGSSKRDGAQMIEIGGSFQARIGNTGVNIDFNYLKGSAGGTQVVKLATSATFTYKNNVIWITYEMAGKSLKLDITGKLVKEDFVLVGGVSIADDPKGRRLGGFIGIRW